MWSGLVLLSTSKKLVMENEFKSEWERLESLLPRPERVRNVVTVDYLELFEAINRQEFSIVKSIIGNLYFGDVYILKGAFPRRFMAELRTNVQIYWNSKPSEFHKMLEGTPDFHRIIDAETGKKYSFRVCKHSAYFYNWNDDPLKLFDMIYERWRVIKQLMGLRPDEYEKNTPKDGVVDRVQIVRYPPRIGFLEPHSDPYKYQRLFFSGYMSKRGVDYKGGGFYLVGSGDKVVEVEDRIDVGDVCIGYATILHGVAPVDKDKEPNWEGGDGRWFLSMYSNESDEVLNRHTGHAVRVSIDGAMPEEYM